MAEQELYSDHWNEPAGNVDAYCSTADELDSNDKLNSNDDELDSNDKLNSNDDELSSNDDELDSVGFDTAGSICLDLDPLAQWVDDKAFALIHIESPSWFINPEFKFLFDYRSSFDSIAACSPFTFAPGLYDVLTADKPPSIDYFRALPPADGLLWAVYAVVVDKEDEESLLYVGSGTDATGGVLLRLAHYKPKCDKAPLHVRLALKRGYHIAHRGLLCWTPLPTAGLVPRVRARMLAVEALFAFLFFAVFAAITDSLYQHIMPPWRREESTWGPLCSHSPLNEKIAGDIHLSIEEVELVSAIQKARRVKYVKAHRAARKARDPDAFRARDRVTKNAWSARHHKRLAKVSANNRQKARASRRFACDTCDLALQSQHALTLHLSTASHADRVAGVEKPEANKYNNNLQKARRAKTEANLYRCDVCEKSFPNTSSLSRHNEGKRHIARVAKAKASL
ncbi:PCK1-phosphoenolpyruvate carboxykinase [Pyrenophora teres f. maculata]|nr:PCK1-phosphoenolpyruvate carboxykinase [Pyrenophora teres f. maculata]